MYLSQGPHAEAAADSAGMYVAAPYFIDDFIHGKAGQHGDKTPVPLYAENGGEVLFPAAVVQETVITDFPETGREHMHHETAYELLTGKGHLYRCRMIPVILCGKGDRLL